MTTEEKRAAIIRHCDAWGSCRIGKTTPCPLFGGLCYSQEAPIDDNYEKLVKAGLIKPYDEVDRKNDEIEFVKVEHEEAEAEERGRVTEKKIISTALHGYGADKQRIKCIEELSELQKELCKDAIGNGSQFHIAEEIADVEIVIAQMKIYYGCARDVAAIKAQKLKQLAKNLGMESDED